LAGNRKAQWNGNESQERPRREGPKKEDSREKGPRGKSEFASGIENGPGSRDDWLKRSEPLANQRKPLGNEGTRTNAVGGADRAGRWEKKRGQKAEPHPQSFGLERAPVGGENPQLRERKAPTAKREIPPFRAAGKIAESGGDRGS
jgi:hypothetical protein